MELVPLEQLAFETFANLVNTKFRVWITPNDSVELELAEATTPRVISSGGTNAPVFESFSLVFVGPAERMLPQHSYVFESERVGRFELFIVPIGRDQKGAKYEAAFNRKRNA